jgi:hypothetical protein
MFRISSSSWNQSSTSWTGSLAHFQGIILIFSAGPCALG